MSHSLRELLTRSRQTMWSKRCVSYPRALALVIVLFSLLGSSPAMAELEVAAGFAGGGAFSKASVSATKNYFDFAASPIIAAKWDPFGSAFRPIFGIASLPTFVYSSGYDAGAIPIIVAEVGLAYGTDATRVALVGHAGLLSLGAGLHFTYTPWELAKGVKTGFEVRTVWMTRKAGYGALLWAFRFG